MDMLHWPDQTQLRLAPLIALTLVMNDGGDIAIGENKIRFQSGWPVFFRQIRVSSPVFEKQRSVLATHHHFPPYFLSLQHIHAMGT